MTTRAWWRSATCPALLPGETWLDVISRAAALAASLLAAGAVVAVVISSAVTP